MSTAALILAVIAAIYLPGVYARLGKLITRMDALIAGLELWAQRAKADEDARRVPDFPPPPDDPFHPHQ